MKFIFRSTARKGDGVLTSWFLKQMCEVLETFMLTAEAVNINVMNHVRARMLPPKCFFKETWR